MRRAYLLIALPAAIVGICYFVIFRSLGMELRAAPFLGAAAAMIVAVLGVRYYQRRHPPRKPRRPGS